jgi:hypothetical protein
VRSRTAGVMTTLMRNGRDRRSENPFWADARKERVVLVGTDQRITSGPAATAAASRRRQSSKRKQAGYMAAPERFAEMSDSSCTAGAVHTWPQYACQPPAYSMAPKGRWSRPLDTPSGAISFGRGIMSDRTILVIAACCAAVSVMALFIVFKIALG